MNSVNGALMIFFLLLSSLLFSSISFAQEVMENSNWSIHGQATTVSQEHGNFSSLYSGVNSLSASAESHTSLTSTLFLGRKLWENGEIYVDPEVTGGSGLSGTHGLAGFSNGEIFRVTSPDPQTNLSRLYLKQVFNFPGEEERIEDDQNKIAKTVSQSRLTIVGGKFSLNDFFDDNSYSHDPRTQFLNFSLMDNGAWDYAADTRGYTIGLYTELHEPTWSIRYARVAVPKEANQMDFDTHLSQAYADNLEAEKRYKLWGHPGTSRLLYYINHAHMGAYAITINTPLYEMDITKSRSYTRKYGFGWNLEQEVSSEIGTFLRAGWSDGQTETWNFTEVDQTLSFGASLSGGLWGRKSDTLGAAYILNGLSRDHRDYLADGGYGFLIGDGKLNYGLEKILETYYLWKVWQPLGISADLQYVQNPAYNKDRGPLLILAARLHAEF